MYTNVGSMFAPGGVFVVLTFLPIILYLVLTGFGIYFVIKVIKFMNEKQSQTKKGMKRLMN